MNGPRFRLKLRDPLPSHSTRKYDQMNNSSDANGKEDVSHQLSFLRKKAEVIRIILANQNEALISHLFAELTTVIEPINRQRFAEHKEESTTTNDSVPSDVRAELLFDQMKGKVLNSLARSLDKELIENIFNIINEPFEGTDVDQRRLIEADVTEQVGYRDDEELEFHLSDYKSIKIKLLDHHGRELAMIWFDRLADTPPSLQIEFAGPDGHSETFLTRSLNV